MGKLKCSAKTRSGKGCENPAMKDSAYCYVHSIGKLRRVPWWKNTYVHAISILGLVIGAYQLFVGATSTKQDTIIGGVGKVADGQKEALKAMDKTSKLVQDVNSGMKRALREGMQEIDETSYPALIRKYPAGYMLFGVGDPALVVPGSSRLLDDYEFDWDSVAILELKPDLITLTFPGIEYKLRHVKYTGCNFTLHRSNPRGVFTFDEFVRMGFPHKICVEIISDDRRGIIFVIGFRQREEAKSG
jgi:hypothetical protein